MSKEKIIPKNTILPRSAQVREVTEDLIEKRQAEFVISSETVDSYNTVFKLDGWDLKRYTANPVVFYVHAQSSSDPDLLIGTGEVFREADQLIGRVTFEPATINPLAEKVFQKVQHGTLRMASVGFYPLDYRFGEGDDEDPDVLYFTETELREFSIVPIGANPDALKRNKEAIEGIRSELKARDIDVKDPKEETPEAGKVRMNVQEAQSIINKNKSL